MAALAQTDNMHGCIASDCPHRERPAYTGDGQAAVLLTAMHNFDAAAFYSKRIRDIWGAQNVETGTCPTERPGSRAAEAAWHGEPR